MGHTILIAGKAVEKYIICTLREASTSILLFQACKHGAVYTMDDDVIPRPCESCDWMLNSSWDHFGLHHGKLRPK